MVPGDRQAQLTKVKRPWTRVPWSASVNADPFDQALLKLSDLGSSVEIRAITARITTVGPGVPSISFRLNPLAKQVNESIDLVTDGLPSANVVGRSVGFFTDRALPLELLENAPWLHVTGFSGGAFAGSVLARRVA